MGSTIGLSSWQLEAQLHLNLYKLQLGIIAPVTAVILLYEAIVSSILVGVVQVSFPFLQVYLSISIALRYNIRSDPNVQQSI